MDSDDITKARSAFEIFRDEHFQRERAAGREVNWCDEEFWVMLKAEFGALSDEDRQYYTDLSETSAGLAKVNRLRKKDEKKQASAANTPRSAKKDEAAIVRHDPEQGTHIVPVASVHHGRFDPLVQSQARTSNV